MRVGDGLVKVAQGALAAHQPLQHARELAAQMLRLIELPVLEVRAVPNAESGQEVVAVDRRRLSQRTDAGGAYSGRWVAMRPACREMAEEGVHVYPEAGAALVSHSPPLAFCSVERVRRRVARACAWS